MQPGRYFLKIIVSMNDPIKNPSDRHDRDKSKFGKRRLWGRDIHLNVGPREGAVRIILGMGLPILFIWFHNSFFIWVIVLISIYFFISGLTLFCFVKHFWNRWVLQKREPLIADPEAPVEHL
jgi:hypothetical protein